MQSSLASVHFEELVRKAGGIPQLCQALDEYTRKTFYEWTQTVDREPMKLLEVPLMCRSVEKPGMIDINFDR